MARYKHFDGWGKESERSENITKPLIETTENAWTYLRFKVKLLEPDFALALTWWSASFPTSKLKVVGDTTMDFQKFDNSWKIGASHSSTGGV
jgi:hypothetical protein